MEDFLKVSVDELNHFLKTADDFSSPSLYEDANGKEFSPSDIIRGFKPAKPYKIKSNSDRVNNPNFGKLK